MNTDYFASGILICNSSGSLSYVEIEPWGEEILLQKGDQLHIVGRGPTEGGAIKLNYDGDALFVEAEPGSTVSFTLNGEALTTASRVIQAL